MRAPAIFIFALLVAFSGITLCCAKLDSQDPKPAGVHSFVGFDRNEYPGDAALPLLHKSYSFAGYWLSPPPGEKSNSWIGKRGVMQAQGFGFLLLFQRRTSEKLPYKKDSIEAGLADAKAAAAAARRHAIAQRASLFLHLLNIHRL